MAGSSAPVPCPVGDFQQEFRKHHGWVPVPYVTRYLKDLYIIRTPDTGLVENPSLKTRQLGNLSFLK